MSELAGRYQGAFEKAFDAIVVADDDGRYIDANQSACDLFGLEKDDLLGRSIEEFAPEDYDFEAEWRDFQASEGDVATFPLIRADGERRTVEYAATPNIVPGEHLSILRDITERREHERQLRETKTRYRQLVEQNLIGIYVIQDREFTYVNPRLADIFGETPEAMIGRSPLDWIIEEDHDRVGENLRKREEGEVDSLEFTVSGKRSDGELIEFQVHGGRVSIDGQPAILGTLQDITERRAREQELETVRRRFEAVLENTTTPMYMKAATGEYIFVNREYRELFDLQDGEVVGRTDHDLHPREMADAVQQNDRTVIETGEPVEIEERVIVDGEEHVYLSTKVPIYDTGEHSDPDDPVAVFGVSVDITERKQFEEQLSEEQQFVKSIFRSLPDPLYALDTEGYPIRWNEKLETVTGYSGDELEDMHVTELIHEEDRDALMSNFQPVIESKQPVTAETIVQTKHGKQISYEVTGGPLEDADGTVRGVTGIARNITIRKRRERQLEDFASIVSHDLRNPLNVAEGRLELAREECDSEHLDSIDRALTRMGALIDDLLTLAREGNEVSQTEPVEIDELVESCWRHVDTAEATLVVDVSCSIQADRSRLQQLFENLIRNAVEHAGEDVTVTVGELDNGFYLEDDGPGIPQDGREDVFEAGYSTHQEGTGFGLPIVKQVAEAHDWDVQVSTGSSGGARFEITGVEFTNR